MQFMALASCPTTLSRHLPPNLTESFTESSSLVQATYWSAVSCCRRRNHEHWKTVAFRHRGTALKATINATRTTQIWIGRGIWVFTHIYPNPSSTIRSQLWIPRVESGGAILLGRFFKPSNLLLTSNIFQTSNTISHQCRTFLPPSQNRYRKMNY